MVSTTGIRISPEKIKAIAEQPVSHDVKSVQSFLGFTNFNRRFIEGYSKIALPLTDITKREKGFQQGSSQQKIARTVQVQNIVHPRERQWSSGRLEQAYQSYGIQGHHRETNSQTGKGRIASTNIKFGSYNVSYSPGHYANPEGRLY